MTLTLAHPAADLERRCVARLKDCLDPATGLFDRQIRDGAWAPTLGTEAITSTAICLIGLGRSGVPPAEVAGDAADACRRIAARIRSQGYPGGVGLALWAASALRAVAPLTLLAEAGLEPAMLERAVLPRLTTMEVAWLASGLLHADHPALASACAAALREIEHRLGPGPHVFRHASGAAPLRHRLRGRIANFADQVYPLQALAFAAIACGDGPRRDLATRCAEHLVARQGPLGQWWWHHDAATGAVAGQYPVYSVHQHSMAPMALRALALAGGPDHGRAAARGRAWLQANELGIGMVDPETGIIWRSIERDEPATLREMRHAWALLGAARDRAEAPPPRLRLNREIRPYEWGWLLYATALDRAGSPPEGHIA